MNIYHNWKSRQNTWEKKGFSDIGQWTLPDTGHWEKGNSATAYLPEGFQAATQPGDHGSQNLAVRLGMHVGGLGCFPNIGLAKLFIV